MRMAKDRFLPSRLTVAVGSKDPWLWASGIIEMGTGVSQDLRIYTNLP